MRLCNRTAAGMVGRKLSHIGLQLITGLLPHYFLLAKLDQPVIDYCQLL